MLDVYVVVYVCTIIAEFYLVQDKAREIFKETIVKSKSTLRIFDDDPGCSNNDNLK